MFYLTFVLLLGVSFQKDLEWIQCVYLPLRIQWHFSIYPLSLSGKSSAFTQSTSSAHLGFQTRIFDLRWMSNKPIFMLIRVDSRIRGLCNPYEAMESTCQQSIVRVDNVHIGSVHLVLDESCGQILIAYLQQVAMLRCWVNI